MNAQDDPLRVPPTDTPDTPAHRGEQAPEVELERAVDEQAESAMGSNPNGNGPHGLEGGMGVSSERTGPAGNAPRSTNPIENTGTKGSAVHSTDGGLDTSPAPRGDEDVQGSEGVE